MRLEQFFFDLPESCIAHAPAEPRDSARLLVVSEEIEDRTVRDLPDLLHPGDILVFNDTKVIPARLLGRRGEARVEILLHRPLGARHWEAFARPAKRLRPGDRVVFAEDFHADVDAKREDGMVELRFAEDEAALHRQLSRYGRMPLPPYISRPQGATAEDAARYQTVYARKEGAVAAPTAGLHFTPELLARLTARGVKSAFVTLHVGAGTFQPVKVENIRDHVMHEERFTLSAEAAETINAARAGGGRVVAVGTTSVRVLESAANDSGRLTPRDGGTDIFITPGYRFKCVDAMVTNFHLPKSTLFMLVSAFAGSARMKEAYAHAIAHGYRFYSYGDACLLLPCR